LYGYEKAFIFNVKRNLRGKTMNWDSIKNLGGIGALLLFIGAILFIVHPYIGGTTAFVGFILVLVALHEFADYYKDQGIFTTALYGFIAGIVAVVVSVAVVFLAVLPQAKDTLQLIYPGWDGNWASLAGMTPSTANLNPNDFIPLFGSLVLILFVIWIFAIIITFLYRKPLKTLAEKSGKHLFETTSLILLIGGVLTIVLIGLLLIWVALLMLAIAFFTMKKQEPAPADAAVAPAPSSI